MREIDLRRPAHALATVLVARVVYTIVLAAGAFYSRRSGDIPQQDPAVEWSLFDRIWLYLIEPWIRRDTAYFLEIADSGFSRELGTTAFHPLYPYLAKLTGFGIAPSLGLWLVSTVSAAAFLVVLSRYVDEVHGEYANRTAWAALLAPAGICWMLLYTEALFCVWVVAAMWAAHRSWWLRAALFAALAVWTRQQGLVLAFVFAWYGWEAFRESRPALRAWFAAAAVPVAYLAWSAVRVLVVDGGADVGNATIGDWVRVILVSENAQAIAPGQRFAWPWEPLLSQMSLWFEDTDRVHLLLDTVMGWTLIAALVVAWKRLTPAERIWSAGVTLLAVTYYNGVIAPYMALPRHMIVAFPLYLGIARWLEGKSLRLFVAVGILINLALAAAFATLRWIP